MPRLRSAPLVRNVAGVHSITAQAVCAVAASGHTERSRIQRPLISSAVAARTPLACVALLPSDAAQVASLPKPALQHYQAPSSHVRAPCRQRPASGHACRDEGRRGDAEGVGSHRSSEPELHRHRHEGTRGGRPPAAWRSAAGVRRQAPACLAQSARSQECALTLSSSCAGSGHGGRCLLGLLHVDHKRGTTATAADRSG